MKYEETDCVQCSEPFRYEWPRTIRGRRPRVCSDECRAARNRQQSRAASALRTVDLRALKDVPCMDCGNRFPPECMDFDHRPGEVKLFNLGNGGTRTMEILTTEIAKCDVVCSNCHRKRTRLRGGALGRPRKSPGKLSP